MCTKTDKDGNAVWHTHTRVNIPAHRQAGWVEYICHLDLPEDELSADLFGRR